MILPNLVHLKLAASVLWKYADPDGNEFYLLRKLVPVRSPYSGRSFSVKPERVSLSDIGKELKSDVKAERSKAASDDFWKAASTSMREGAEAKGKALPGTLWEYSDEEGNKFYLPKRQPGALKSPFTGKTFTSKPIKNTLSDVGKDIKEMSSKKAADDQDSSEGQTQQGQQKEAALGDLWKVDPSFGVLAQQQEEEKQEDQQKTACGCKESPTADPSAEAQLILDQGEKHPALIALFAAYSDVVKAAASAKGANDSVKASSLDSAVKYDAASVFVLAKVKPAVEKLAKVAAVIAKQMEVKIK